MEIIVGQGYGNISQRHWIIMQNLLWRLHYDLCGDRTILLGWWDMFWTTSLETEVSCFLHVKNISFSKTTVTMMTTLLRELNIKTWHLVPGITETYKEITCKKLLPPRLLSNIFLSSFKICLWITVIP